MVFEPHTFSRIKTFFDDFVESLKASSVDQIYITQVFRAREQGNINKLGQDLARAIGPKATFTGSLKETSIFIKKHMQSFDVICLMGAGDVYKIYDMLKT